MAIKDSLRRTGALGAKDLHLIPSEWIPKKVPQTTKTLSSQPSSATKILSSKPSRAKKLAVTHKHTDWLGKERSTLMVMASLLATVAFQAGLTPPGGVWQDDYVTYDNGNPVLEPHIAETSMMAYKGAKAYGLSIIFNPIAFLSSLSVILVQVSGLTLTRRRWMWLQMITVWVAITAQAGTFFAIQ